MDRPGAQSTRVRLCMYWLHFIFCCFPQWIPLAISNSVTPMEIPAPVPILAWQSTEVPFAWDWLWAAAQAQPQALCTEGTRQTRHPFLPWRQKPNQLSHLFSLCAPEPSISCGLLADFRESSAKGTHLSFHTCFGITATKVEPEGKMLSGCRKCRMWTAGMFNHSSSLWFLSYTHLFSLFYPKLFPQLVSKWYPWILFLYFLCWLHFHRAALPQAGVARLNQTSVLLQKNEDQLIDVSTTAPSVRLWKNAMTQFLQSQVLLYSGSNKSEFQGG